MQPRRRVFAVLALVALVVALPLVAGEVQQRMGLGPLEGLPTPFNTTTLSTTPVKVTVPTSVNGVKCKLTTPPSGSNTVAWSIVVKDAPAPTITADFASTGASPIYPGGAEVIELQPNRDLYVVASGASTTFNSTCFAFN